MAAKAIQASIDGALEQELPDGDCWLAFIDYTVHYDADGVLDISVRVSGQGSYPSTHTSHLVFDVATGKPLTAATAFRAGVGSSLARVVDRKLQAAVRRGPSEDAGGERYEGGARFEVGNLDQFIVTSRGLVFFFDFGLPHGSQALNPDSEYSMSAAELRPFIEPTGPLGWMTR